LLGSNIEGKIKRHEFLQSKWHARKTALPLNLIFSKGMSENMASINLSLKTSIFEEAIRIKLDTSQKNLNFGIAPLTVMAMPNFGSPPSLIIRLSEENHPHRWASKIMEWPAPRLLGVRLIAPSSSTSTGRVEVGGSAMGAEACGKIAAKAGASPGSNSRRAWRRQSKTCCGLICQRRATALTTGTGCAVSATIRALSWSDHCRRRTGPVRRWMRWYPTPRASKLTLSIASA
jgi:hypothetical protein